VVAVSDVDTTRRLHHKKLVEDFYTTKQDKAFKGCAEYKDFRELIARKDIDAVVVATPDHWHAYPVVAAARAKKDIFCEKPLSLTIHEARAMAQAVRENQRVFQTGSMQRVGQRLLEGLHAGAQRAIGDVQEVTFPWVARASGAICRRSDGAGSGLGLLAGPAPVRPYNSVLSPRGVHDNFRTGATTASTLVAG